MTTKQTLQALRKAGKPICLSHLYRLLAVLDIKPEGRSRPQNYPAHTATMILSYLGFSSGKAAVEPLSGASRVKPAPAGKLISVRALRAAKKQTKGTK